MGLQQRRSVIEARMITVTPEDNGVIFNTVPGAHILVEMCGPVNRHLCVEPHEDDRLVVAKIPTDIPNGIYYLYVRYMRLTDRLCTAGRKMKVNVQMCQPATILVTHEPTFPDAGETIMECCEEDTGQDGN